MGAPYSLRVLREASFPTAASPAALRWEQTLTTTKKTMSATFVALALVLGAALLWEPAAAQNKSCRLACWHAYGACYKATNSRARCQAKLKRCLDRCIRRKR